MLRTRAVIAPILALLCVVTWCAALVASPSRAAEPSSSTPATTTSTSPTSNGPVTGPGAGPPVQVKVLVEVPPLVGLSEDELVKRLAASGLTLGKVTGTVRALVTAQSPPAGSFIDPTVPIDVTLGVATRSFVVVPDVRRLSIAHARRAVLARGLRFVTTSRRGSVSTQNPPAGTVVGPGRTVSVSVGSRVVVRYVEVPDVRGDSVGAARAALTDIGLTMSAPASSGTVAAQNPQPGQRARIGSGVSVTINVVAAPTSARPGSPSLYWVIGALAFIALGVAGGSAAHRRLRGDRGHDKEKPTAPPAPRVTSRLTADTVRTTRGGPAGPTIELRTRERASVTIERIP